MKNWAPLGHGNRLLRTIDMLMRLLKQKLN